MIKLALIISFLALSEMPKQRPMQKVELPCSGLTCAFGATLNVETCECIPDPPTEPCGAAICAYGYIMDENCNCVPE